MGFEEYKKSAMEKYYDAQKKGLVDKDIVRHLDGFNRLKNYYTTSSCSGRIMLVKRFKGLNKAPDSFYYKSHSPVNFSEFMKAINNYEGGEELWISSQSFILHIGCRELIDAKKLLDYCHLKGIKRAGITAFGKRIIVEIIGTQTLSTIIAKGKKLLVDKSYLKELINKSNLKLKEAKRVLYEFFNDSKVLK